MSHFLIFILLSVSFNLQSDDSLQMTVLDRVLDGHQEITEAMMSFIEHPGLIQGFKWPAVLSGKMNSIRNTYARCGPTQ